MQRKRVKANKTNEGPKELRANILLAFYEGQTFKFSPKGLNPIETTLMPPEFFSHERRY